MHYRAIIFDFDGTLADTLELTRSIYNKLAPGYGLRNVEAHEVPTLRDFSLKDLLLHLDISKFRVPSLLARGTSMLREQISEIAIIPGIAAMIPELRRVLKRLHHPLEVMLVCARCYAAYALSFRHLEEMVQERGVFVDHAINLHGLPEKNIIDKKRCQHCCHSHYQ